MNIWEMDSEQLLDLYKKALRREVLQEVEKYPGPDKLIRRDVKIAGDQNCPVGKHSICEMVNGVCQIGGDNCERD